ncbi:hypothetical protein [Paraburkholderia sp. JHI869]|uniref:hypothetical protein n=1 Tax=Paraburkholderia sp. JHI869 TaxID=3112959 RepID=UPI0031742F9F
MFYLQITLKVSAENRPAAAQVYAKYKEPFLSTIKGAKTKELLIREEDVQVLHGFDGREAVDGYLESSLFNMDVVESLKPLLGDAPEVRIYQVG